MNIDSTINISNLDTCFRKVDTFSLSCNPKYIHNINLFVLNNINEEFDYEALKNLIRNNLANYVFNRRKIKSYKDTNTIAASGLDAQKKLVEISENALEKKNFGSGGELGEILLYIFLEGFCGSKKLLSKVEMKTNNQDFAKGFDGVHFYKKNSNIFEIIFGEAKIKDKLNEGITEAFKSLSECFNNKSNEFSLLEESILNEFAEDIETISALKQILIPKYQDANNIIEIENAFSIFIGYTFIISEDTCELNTKDRINAQIKIDANDVKKTIINKINSGDFGNKADYYIYLLPFNNATEDKKNIMQDIAGIRVK